MTQVVMTLTDTSIHRLDIQIDFNPEIDGRQTLPYSQEIIMKFLTLFEPDRISASRQQLNLILHRHPLQTDQYYAPDDSPTESTAPAAPCP